MVSSRAIGLGFGMMLAASCAAHAADGRLARILAEAAHKPARLAGQDMHGLDLAGLDLSGADLRGANLAGAELKGVKLVGADLQGADLAGADMTEVWIIRANFDHADLHGATLQVVVTSTGMNNTADQAASFNGANLSDTSATVHFSYDSMKGADFAGTHMSVVLMNQSMGLLRSEFEDCELEGANFRNAQLARVDFKYAKLKGADFRGADLTRAEFEGADLTNVDFTGARFDHTSFDGATLSGARGLPRSR